MSDFVSEKYMLRQHCETISEKQLNVIEIIILCPSRLHLFEQKYSNTKY